MKFKRGKVVGFKVGVYGKAVGNTKEKPASNSCVFATHKEAQRAGDELLDRWMGAEGFRVVEQTKEVPNYVFMLGHARPRGMTDTEKSDVARAIATHTAAIAQLKEQRNDREGTITLTSEGA